MGRDMRMNDAKFAPGQLIHHVRFDYRGVVYDVDAVFSGTDEWYEKMARSQPPKDAPWYHVLVDGASHTTYIAERNLESATELAPIQHPLLDSMFDQLMQEQRSLKAELRQSQTSVVSVSDLEIKPPVPEVETKVRKDTDLDD